MWKGISGGDDTLEGYSCRLMRELFLLPERSWTGDYDTWRASKHAWIRHGMGGDSMAQSLLVYNGLS